MPLHSPDPSAIRTTRIAMAMALEGKCYNCGSAQQNPASPTCYNCGSAQQYTDEEEEDEEEDREKVMDQGLEGEPKTLAGGAMDASRLIAELPGGWIIAELPGGCQAQPAAKRPRLEVEQMARQMVEEEFAKESSSLVEPVERLLLHVCEIALEKCQKKWTKIWPPVAWFASFILLNLLLPGAFDNILDQLQDDDYPMELAEAFLLNPDEKEASKYREAVRFRRT